MTPETIERTTIDQRLDELIEEQEALLLARQPRSRALSDRARRSLAGGVTSSWQITRPQAMWISHGVGLEDRRRRRHRVRRPPRRLRRRRRGACAPGDRRGRVAARSRGDALRAADRGCADRERGAGATLGVAALAVCQLRHRSHHGRGASHARDHGSLADRENRRLLSRAPRLGAGLGLPGRGRDRRRVAAQQRPVQLGRAQPRSRS